MLKFSPFKNWILEKKEFTEELPSLPSLFVQKTLGYLSAPDLRSCRGVCRTWNAIIINSGFLSDISSIFLAIPSPPRPLSYFTSLIFRPQIITYLQELQWNYVLNLSLFSPAPISSFTILNVEELPSFAKHYHPNFIPLLANISSLYIGRCKKQFKLTESQMSSIFSGFGSSKLRNLTLPAQLLRVMTPAVATEKFRLVSELQVSFTEFNQEEISSVALFIAQPALKELRRLTVRYHPDGLGRFVAVGPVIKSSAGKLHKEYLNDMLRSALGLNHLEFLVEGVPMDIFDETGFLLFILFLRMRGLEHLGIALYGSVLSISLATTLSTLLREDCDVALDLYFMFENMAEHVRNNLVLSLPEVTAALRTLSLHFTMSFKTNFESYCLRHFFPKNINLDPNLGLVEFTSLTKLSVTFESSQAYVFLDFSNIAIQLPSLVDITIDIPRPRTTIVSRIFGYTIERLCCNMSPSELRMIFEGFPKLKRLVVKAPMPSVDIDTFSGDVKGYRLNLKNISQLLKHLEHLTLHGVGKKLSCETLQYFHGMDNLRCLKLIGQHKISEKAGRDLMAKLPLLKKCVLK